MGENVVWEVVSCCARVPRLVEWCLIGQSPRPRSVQELSAAMEQQANTLQVELPPMRPLDTSAGARYTHWTLDMPAAVDGLALVMLAITQRV